MAALLMAVAVSAQTVFIENMGTVSSNTAIATHDANGGFQNSAAYDFTGTGDVRTSTASSGYTGASGAGNVFLTSGTLPRTFIIAGINTADHTNLSLSFGAYKSANAPDLTTLHVDYSTDDGTNWSPLTFPAQATGTGTTNWRLITITGGTIPAVPDLWLRWSNTTADLQPRIDDITLSGTLSASCGLTLGAIGTTCDANTVGVDSYTLTIGYTGVQAGATVINNSGSGTVGGSDPTVNENGTIIISGITEGSAYSVTFDTPCEALTVSGASPECAPACDISLSSATATCNSITEGPGDTYNVSIPYTGSQAGVTVNYTGSGTVGGDNPASAGGGTIVISGITEGEAWSISLSAPCGAQTASGSAPLCEPLPLAAWDFTGENQLATSTAEVYDANLDASNLLTRGSGAAASSGANSFRTTGFQNNGIATNNTDYFQLTLSSVPGQQLSLSTIDARFNGTAGYAASPGVQNQFAYSLDGTTFTLIGSPSITIGAPATLPTIDLSGVAALQNVAPGTTITLRYYASGQTSTGGWGFNSPVSGSYGLEINGSFTPIVGCDITLGTPEATCNTVTAGPGDTYNVSIPYTGAQAGVSVVNNGASGIVGGDDPAVTNGGFITITGINETDGYAIALTGACSSASASGDAPSCEPVIDYSVLVINEVDYDNPGSNDNMEFVEILNSGAATLQLEGCKVELVNGSNGLVYTTIILPNHYLAPGDYFVVGNNADIPNVDLVTGASTNFIQNGEPDAVALRDPADNLLDAISYEGSMAAPYTEGTGLAIANSDDGTPGLGISRYPNGTDTDDNSADWSRRCISPGESNNSTSEFCICEPPQATAFAQCVDDNTWEIVVDVTSTGSGATVDITNNVNGASALAAGTGQHIIGPFNNNEVVDVLVAHADTSFCDLSFPGNFMNCFPDCNGVPGGWDLPGQACDDNDPETMNDTWSPGCVCSGTPLQPTVSFSLPFSSVGEDGVSLTVGVEMDVAPSAPVTVEVTDLLTGNATSGSDYGTIGTVSFTFLPEDFYPALVTFNVSITDDTEDEPAETLNLTLSVTSGAATVGNGNFTGMITDNDLPALVINEVDYDNAGTDNAEWLELKNAGSTAIELDGFKVELVNGASGGASVYKTITLPAYALAAGDYYVIGNNASIPNIDLVVTPALDLIQNGAPDAIGLRAPDNTLIDAISYEGNSGAPYTEGSGLPIAQADDNTTASKVIARYLDGNDTNDNSTDWKVWCSTPGASNATVDQDGDLTADCLDGCPADANKTAPGVCGCGVPDSPITWYADADGDSFGDPSITTSAPACEQPVGFVANSGDCDDSDDAIHPGVEDLCDNIDNDCDGSTDEDFVAGECLTCEGGVIVDASQTWYADTDGDGYGDPGSSQAACTQPDGHVSNFGDCNDGDANLTVIGLPCDDGDANTENDLVTVDCTCEGTPVSGPCTQNEVALELTTDATPAQTTWEIVMDDTDDAVCSGGGYAANTTINAACCLPNGCYDLKVYDSAGDGISPGGFTLRDANGQRIIDNSGNGAFFAFESTAPFSFCLPLGNTAFDAASCDILDATPNTVLHVVPDPAVTAVYQPGSTWANSNAGYQYWLFNPHGGYNRRITLTHAIQGSGYPVGTPINLRCSYLKLSQMQSFPVPLGVPLNIRVRTLLNAVYGEWGPACKLLMPTPACPPSQLTTTASPVVSCGATDLSNSSTIYANNVLSATTYQFEFSRPGYLRRIASTTRAQSLNFYTYPLVDNTCYNVRVRVSFDGGTTYCPFGPYCTITLGSADCGFEGMAPLVDDSDYADLVIAEAELTLWPNPNDGSLVNIALNGIDPSLPTVTVDITDAFGKLVASRTIPTQGAYLKTSLDLGHELAPGLYLVNLRAGETLRTQRLVIQ